MFNGPFSGTTRASWYQKGKTNLDFTEARDSEWQWHQLGSMQVCTSLQTDNHASTPPLKFFTGRMPFLPPNQQRQSTEAQHASVTDNSFCHSLRFGRLVALFLRSPLTFDTVNASQSALAKCSHTLIRANFFK